MSTCLRAAYNARAQSSGEWEQEDGSNEKAPAKIRHQDTELEMHFEKTSFHFANTLGTLIF